MGVLLSCTKMKVLALFFVLAVSCSQGARPQFTCAECIDEMHHLGWYVKTYAPYITEYLVEEFCPTTESDDCAHHVAEHYAEMIFAIINHFVIDGATHICQLMSICSMTWKSESSPSTWSRTIVTLTRTSAPDRSWSGSPPCTGWPWRSFSSQMTFARRSQCAPEKQSQLDHHQPNQGFKTEFIQ